MQHFNKAALHLGLHCLPKYPLFMLVGLKKPKTLKLSSTERAVENYISKYKVYF